MKNNIVSLRPQEKHFEIGNTESVSTFLELLENNFQKGERNIAFSSTNYKSIQHKCIVLGAHHFNHLYPGSKVAIVTFSWDMGMLKPFYNEAKLVSPSTKKFHHHFDLIDWSSLVSDDLAMEQLKPYNLILWDLPDLDFIKKHYDSLKNQIAHAESLYIISLKSRNFQDEEFLKCIQQYYSDHGLDIAQILPWKLENSKRDEKKNIIDSLMKIFGTKNPRKRG